jgi:hypothetical protein
MKEQPEEGHITKKARKKNVTWKDKKADKETTEKESSESGSSEDENEGNAPRPVRQRRKPDRLNYERLGSLGYKDRSRDKVFGYISQILTQQQVLLKMMSTVFGGDAGGGCPDYHPYRGNNSPTYQDQRYWSNGSSAYEDHPTFRSSRLPCEWSTET